MLCDDPSSRLVSSCLVFWAMSYTQLSAGVRVESLSGPGTREPRDLVQSFQYANGPPPAATHRQRDGNDDDPNVHMSICSYRPTEIFRFRLALRRRGLSQGEREQGEGVQERGAEAAGQSGCALFSA